jgi:hypothetical protein
MSKNLEMERIAGLEPLRKILREAGVEDQISIADGIRLVILQRDMLRKRLKKAAAHD